MNSLGNLLLVDDDEEILEILMDDTIDICGETFFAENISQAQYLLRQNDIAAILCDLEMPGKNGL
jgi:CheY-like chemotaxis protein